MDFTDADKQALRNLSARSKKRGFRMTGADQALMMKAAKAADEKTARERYQPSASAVELATYVLKKEGYTS